MATKEENTARVVDYLEKHKITTEDEIAEALALHIVDVLDILHSLEKEGKAKSLPD
jgi:transcription initiation factor IIE alpha subunit